MEIKATNKSRWTNAKQDEKWVETSSRTTADTKVKYVLWVLAPTRHWQYSQCSGLLLGDMTVIDKLVQPSKKKEVAAKVGMS